MCRGVLGEVCRHVLGDLWWGRCGGELCWECVLGEVCRGVLVSMVLCLPVKAELSECHDRLESGGLAGAGASRAHSNHLRVLLPLLPGSADEPGTQE